MRVLLLPGSGGSTTRRRWAARCACRVPTPTRGLGHGGYPERVHPADEEFEGEACGLDDDGSLLVRVEGGQIRRCLAGEIAMIREPMLPGDK